ncbi:MAG: hypothetical protein ACRC6S_02900, partial [Shewanella sp.]
MVPLLIAIIVLQFAGANFGAHQLHAGNGVQEAENHPHLQFSAQVTTTTMAPCIDCVCSSDATLSFAGTDVATDMLGQSVGKREGKSMGKSQARGFHSHLVEITEIQD